MVVDDDGVVVSFVYLHIYIALRRGQDMYEMMI